MDPRLDALLAFADGLADDARALARHHFRSGFGLQTKADATPVTAADRAIEQRWRERIAARWPDHGVLGEEEGATRADAEWLWVLDPIDGTKAFATGSPMFGCLIGLMQRGVPVLGVLEAPALRQRFSAVTGGPARRGGAAMRVRAERPLAQAALAATTPEYLLADAGYGRLRRQVPWAVYGGDCLAYAQVAAGDLDLVVDRGLRPYDWCALVPIVQAAGGVLVDWRERPLTLDGDGTALAATGPRLARAASALLRGDGGCVPGPCCETPLPR